MGSDLKIELSTLSVKLLQQLLLLFEHPRHNGDTQSQPQGLSANTLQSLAQNNHILSLGY
jgi:hypothetical protein